MNVKTVREGLAANLSTYLTDMQVSAFVLTNPTPPAIHILPERAEQTVAMQRGHVTRDFLVQAMVGMADSRGAQEFLDDLLSEEAGGTNRVVEAILSDPTLGGACSDLMVVDDSGYQIFSREGQPPVLGAEWRVRVYG